MPDDAVYSIFRTMVFGNILKMPITYRYLLLNYPMEMQKLLNWQSNPVSTVLPLDR
jgi:hypothetical protein